jgi:hypothetical protein
VSRKVRVVLFWILLGLATGFGAPYDPKQTEDIVRIMNETKVEVVLEKGDGPPAGDPLEPGTLPALTDAASVSSPGIHWRERLKRFLEFS